MTIDEMERAAYAAGNTALADAYGRVIDLENKVADLRGLVHDAVDFIAIPREADRILGELRALDGA